MCLLEHEVQEGLPSRRKKEVAAKGKREGDGKEEGRGSGR